jgi:hypothetical protein
MGEVKQKRAWGLGIVTLGLSILALSAGIGQLSQWPAQALPLRTLNVVLFAAGAVLLGGSAFLLLGRGPSRPALTAVGAAGAVFGGEVILGTLLNIIPCSGPS